jgi:hypothetical protein
MLNEVVGDANKVDSEFHCGVTASSGSGCRITGGREMNDAIRGSLNISTGGGNFSPRAGGDNVFGNKTGGDNVFGNKTTTATVTNGFKQADDKQKFLQQIDELQVKLRELQTKTAEAPGLSQDAKDEIAAEVMQQVRTLKKTKDEAAGLPVAQQPPPGTLQAIQQGLESTGTVLDKVRTICNKAAAIGETIEPYVSKALPILLSARHLFGIP